MLADTWDQNAVLHAVSPTNAVIEETCQSWLIDLLGLPAQTVAGFVSGTSMAIVWTGSGSVAAMPAYWI